MRSIILSVVVFGLLPFCLMHPWIGILAWNWLGLMAPHKLSWGFTRDFPFAYIIAVATLAGLFFTKDKKPVPWNRELILTLWLLAFFALTSFFAWYPPLAWAKWIEIGKVVLMAGVGTMLIFGKERIRLLVIVVALSVGFFGVKGGIWSILTGGNERVMGPEGGYLEGNTSIGMAMVMVIPLLFALAREEKNKWVRNLFLCTAVLNIIATAFTYSRGALLGLATIALLMFFKSRMKILLVLFLIPIGMFGKNWVPEQLYKRADTIGNYQQDDSAMQRIQAWTIHWNIALDYPFTGAGINFIEHPDRERYHSYGNPKLRYLSTTEHDAHSIYFQVLGQHGFICFAIYVLLLMFLYFTFGRLKREMQNHPAEGWIGNYAAAFQIGLVGYMVSGAFLSMAYFELFYLYISFSAILQREALKTSRAPQNYARLAAFPVQTDKSQPVSAQRAPGSLFVPDTATGEQR